jgi:hypothetical protein
MNALYMIRAFKFGAAFDVQFWLLVVALAAAGWDSVRRRRDCWWVLLVGTVTWTAVELALQLSAIRVMPERTLFGVPLPLFLSAPLQGAAEGGAFAVLAMFFGDRLLRRNTRLPSLLGLLALCATAAVVVIPFGDALREVTSRRNMLSVPSVLCGTVFLAVDLFFWLRWPVFRRRAVTMFAVLVAIGMSWTIAGFATGSRWIEVPGPGPDTYSRASPVWQAFGLGYDVIVEFALAYVAFLALPAMVGLIPAEAHRRRAPKGLARE